MQQTPFTGSHSGREAAPANVTSGEPSDVLSRVEELVTSPAFLRWLYRMPFDNPAPTDRNKLGIAGLINQYPREKDLQSFMIRFRRDVNPKIASTQIVTIVPVNGGVDDLTSPSKQANLDTQYSVALTFPTPIEYYTIGGMPQVSPEGLVTDGDNYLEWLRYMNNRESVPQTISVPYFLRELDLSEEYAKSLCDEFKILGARGVSVLAASGDHGVGPGKERTIPFSTSFPASCTCDVYSLLASCTHALAPGLGTSHSPNYHNFAGPWVTSVGGTTGFDPEVGSRISGGGFSVYFERPDYQNDAVPPFLNNLGNRKYHGRYKYVHSRDLTQPILTISSSQPSGPRRP